MKRLLYILFFISMFQFGGCSLVVYDDINRYENHVILKIKKDSIGTIHVTRVYVKTLNKNYINKYKELIIRTEIAELFKINDTI